MQSFSFNRCLMAAALGGVLALSACGGDDKPAPIDLVTDQNRDNVPDELAQLVKSTLKIADAGTPGVLDPEEEPAFFAAINEIGERLPFSAETVGRLERIDALTQQIAAVQTEEERADLLLQLADTDALLAQDANYQRFTDALNAMPELAPSADTAEVQNKSKAIHTGGYDQLQRGDVMLTHSGGIGYAFPWAWHFTHAGNYDGNNTVYESVGSGVRVQPVAHWQENKRYAFGRNKKVSQSAVVAQLEQAQQRYGTAGKTPYNFVFPNKQTDNKLYCSQLVWKIHQGAGTNVDSNSLKWFTLMALKLSPYYAWNPPLALAKHAVLIASVLRPAVAPDEIYYATDVINFYYDKKK